MDNLYDIGQFVRAEGAMARGGEWYTLFFAFQAALTILLSVVWEPQHEQARTWREILLSTAGWFRNLRSMSKVRDLWSFITPPAHDIAWQIIRAHTRKYCHFR